MGGKRGEEMKSPSKSVRELSIASGTDRVSRPGASSRQFTCSEDQFYPARTCCFHKFLNTISLLARIPTHTVANGVSRGSNIFIIS
jgi:hypothetical protein